MCSESELLYIIEYFILNFIWFYFSTLVIKTANPYGKLV